MKIAIGNDHAGIEFKNEMLDYLHSQNIEVINLGTDTKESVDYPDIAKLVCDLVNKKEVDYGIVICGTGIGISIASNKIHGIRAALCHNEFTARLSREHNNANVLALGARVIGTELGKAIVDAFINAKFEGGRHGLRVNKIEN